MFSQGVPASDSTLSLIIRMLLKTRSFRLSWCLLRTSMIMNTLTALTQDPPPDFTVTSRPRPLILSPPSLCLCVSLCVSVCVSLSCSLSPFFIHSLYLPPTVSILSFPLFSTPYIVYAAVLSLKTAQHCTAYLRKVM